MARERGIRKILRGAPHQQMGSQNQGREIFTGDWPEKMFLAESLYNKKILAMDKSAREKLTKLIEIEGENKWWVPEEFEKHIRSQLPTELIIIAPPPASAGNYNCFVYAFGLENNHEFLGGQNPIQKEFVRHLLLNDILKVKEQSVPGDLVFYEDHSGAITHGGIMQSPNKVISKWMWGCIIEHNLWDVPSSFGDKVFFCSPVESAIVRQDYKKYRTSGVEIMSIS